jgi:hypothetical protein
MSDSCVGGKNAMGVLGLGKVVIIVSYAIHL